jgi:proteasome lid subunit RPN8/RPN11
MSDNEPIRTGRIRLGRNTGLLVQPVDPAEDSRAVPDGPDANAVIEAPFPESRLLRWLPEHEQGEKGPENEIALVVTQEVLVEVNRHVSRSLEHELGGFLLGNLYRCPNTERRYLVIDQSARAHFVESSDVHLAFTLDTWASLAEELTGKFLGKLVVGWYHSHPRMDVFLSAYDVAIHEERFPDPWTTALVIEPEKNRGGFFRWQDGKLNPRAPFEFYELVARRAEGSVVHWTNHVLAGGHRPEPDDGGKRSRAFRSGPLSSRARGHETGNLDEPDEIRSQISSVMLVLSGIVIGAALCGGAWLAVESSTATAPGVRVEAPVVAEPAAPIEHPPPSEPAATTPPAADPAPDSEAAPAPRDDPLARPVRKRPASKPGRPARVSNQGA